MYTQNIHLFNGIICASAKLLSLAKIRGLSIIRLSLLIWFETSFSGNNVC